MNSSKILAVAPMMKRTDRHFRSFIRLMSRKTLLYTEMIPAGAIANGQETRFLINSPTEKNTAAQFGGNCPFQLSDCAKAADKWGYSEVNLNAGCPSERVQNGEFGACLMKTPQKTKLLIKAMTESSNLPVSIKIRTGVDEFDSYDYLRDFVGEISAGGCRIFIVHARKAWLKGLNPKQNRTVPPLDYETVYRLKRDFPHLTVVINGGIRSFTEVADHLTQTDGVMIGRMAYDNPLMFLEADRQVFGTTNPLKTVSELVNLITRYMNNDREEHGTHVRYFATHLLKFFRGFPGAANYRRDISNFLLTGQETTGFLREIYDRLPAYSKLTG